MPVVIVACVEPGGQGNPGLAPRKGHLPADSQLCTYAAHNETLRNRAPKREELKAESGDGTTRGRKTPFRKMTFQAPFL